MITLLRQISRTGDRYAGKLFLAGLLGVGVYNWRLWLRDRELATRLRAEHAAVPRLARTPKVSALVAAWNEHDHIDSHIRSFTALKYPNIELILCAGGTDDTLERARRYASERVIVLEQHPGEGKQHALTRCLDHASGEIIYLTDADCLFVDDALIRLLAPLVEDGEQAATGSSRPLDEQADEVLPSYLWSSDVVAGARSPAYREGLLGRNAAITRSALERSGGLDFPARIGTDYHLARRLIRCGVVIRYVASSSVPTEYPETLRVYRRKQSRWLRNLLLYGPGYGAIRDVQLTLKTVATGALMLLVPFFAITFSSSMLVLWSLLVAHAAGSKLRYVLFTARLYQRPASARVLVGLVPLTLIDFGVWASPMLDVLHESRRVQW
jgi:cellulose synthase/poly-beta-1,6-N-acetylglucosamine synthase-like glycosyltransferase